MHLVGMQTFKISISCGPEMSLVAMYHLILFIYFLYVTTLSFWPQFLSYIGGVLAISWAITRCHCKPCTPPLGVWEYCWKDWLISSIKNPDWSSSSICTLSKSCWAVTLHNAYQNDMFLLYDLGSRHPPKSDPGTIHTCGWLGLCLVPVWWDGAETWELWRGSDNTQSEYIGTEINEACSSQFIGTYLIVSFLSP